ncbi:MAG: glycosyltransferase family 4 protein [Bacteroidales bacterium]
MKIIQLIYSLSSGGAERFVVDLSNELAKLGHDVHLIVFRTSSKNGSNVHFYKNLVDENVNYHNLEIDEGFRFSAFVKVTRYIKRINPDIVHSHLNVIPYVFYLALKKGKIKHFHTLHNLAENTVNSKIQKFVNLFFYRTERIRPIAISDICYKSYCDFYRIHNAIIIENGRSPVRPTSQFEKTRNEINSYRSENTKQIFVHIARFSKQKNQDLLIDSFNKLYAIDPDFLLFIIGNGFDSSEGKALQKRACKAIKFLGEKQNVNDYLLSADAFCLTSIYEGLPISLLEALSAGCVPICTPAGGIPNVITKEVTGYLSDEFSVESYYETILNYLSRPDEIKKEYLISYFEMNYSISKCAFTHLNLYKQN